MLPWTEYFSFAVSLLAILTPFAAVPVFLSLTEECPAAECSRLATLATLTAAFVLIVATLLGRPILAILGTSLGALGVGGGLILLLMTFSALRPHATAAQRPAGPARSTIAERSSGAIVPLGLPLLAGPAAISAVIVEMQQGTGLRHEALVIACILSICGTIWALLRLARPIGRRFGPGGLTVINRLSGLLSAAIAVELITDGLHVLFPVLGQNSPLLN
jgi:multiple antibiotic resistance protein